MSDWQLAFTVIIAVDVGMARFFILLIILLVLFVVVCVAASRSQRLRQFVPPISDVVNSEKIDGEVAVRSALDLLQDEVVHFGSSVVIDGVTAQGVTHRVRSHGSLPKCLNLVEGPRGILTRDFRIHYRVFKEFGERG